MSEDKCWGGVHVKRFYASVVGYLMYAMVCTRPDLSYVVSQVYVQPRQATFESSEVDLKVPKGYNRSWYYVWQLIVWSFNCGIRGFWLC